MIKVNDKLKKKYDKMVIGDIEKAIKSSKVLSLEAKRECLMMLLYLRGGRYKENPLYRKSSFQTYLLEFHNMRYNTFLEEVKAFDKFEKETLKYGVGLVSKICRKCKPAKQQLVFEEIKKAEESLKTPIKRDKIESIIIKHATPKPPSAKQNYKELYDAELRAHEITKQRYADVTQELKQAKEQIEKLKETVLKLKPLQEMKQAIMPFIISEEKDQTENRVH